MATTTNYGWTTPDDTALVKDGASAIRSLGTSVDTTTKNLNPSTTLGDIEYRSSTANTNTRLGIGTSGQALTVVAGVPSWAASPTSVLTTTGDTLYASAANTLARLGIGSTGQVLTVSGGLPTWATASSGGMTEISSGSLSGAVVALSSIPGTYKDIRLIVRDFYPSADDDIALEINDTINIYGQSTNMTQTSGLTSTYLFPTAPVDNRDADNYLDITFLDYTNSVKKNYVAKSVVGEQGSAQFIFRWMQGAMNLTAAITKIELLFNGGATFSGGSYILYGVK